MIYGIIDVATIATITTRIITAAIFRVCFGLNTFFQVWGKGMANEGKRCALKNLVTNLRKVLSEDGSLQIINRRWSGYALTNIWTL